MEWWLIFSILLGGLITLMLIGLPVAFSFIFITILVMSIMMGIENGSQQLILSMYNSLTKFSLTAIPLFVIMGEILFHSGLASRTLDVLSKWLGPIPGRLSVLTLLGGGLFASLSGSTVANTAMFGALMVPEMVKRGYKNEMILGPIMGSGALAMVIPPSALAVLLGSIAEISVGRLLIAAFLPGLLLLALFLIYTIGRCWLNPNLAPKYQVSKVSSGEKLLLTVRDLLPLGSIIFLVLGLIFFGVATPTEAAALGALGSMILVAAYKRMSYKVFYQSLFGTLRVTVMIYTIIAGSAAFSQILAFSGATRGMVQLVLSLSIGPNLILLTMLVTVIILGCFMEQVSIMMITIPMFMPIINALGFDPIWFAVLVLICLEIGQLTPPVGLALFVMKGAAPAEVSMKDIYKSALPFVACDIVGLMILIYIPAIATWLPNLI